MKNLKLKFNSEEAHFNSWMPILRDDIKQLFEAHGLKIDVSKLSDQTIIELIASYENIKLD